MCYEEGNYPKHGHRHSKHGYHRPKHGGFCFPFTGRDIGKMKQMAGHFMKNFMGGFGRYVPYNSEDLGDSYLITIPLPGRTKENVEVSLIGRNLNIKAKKPKIIEKEESAEKAKEESESHPFPWRGFTFIDVNMDIQLPADADEDSISSKIANGLLRIKLGKKPAKNINIDDEGSTQF